jgi:hypothetical protein
LESQGIGLENAARRVKRGTVKKIGYRKDQAEVGGHALRMLQFVVTALR